MNYSFPFIDKSEKLTRKYFNRNFIVRYFPNKKDRHNNYLIGYDRFMSEIEVSKRREKILSQIMEMQSEKLDLSPHKGIKITIVQR